MALARLLGLTLGAWYRVKRAVIGPRVLLFVARSGKWPAFRARWLADHPCCEACGRTDSLEVHHITPFHVDPSRELDPTNVVTLCEHAAWNCHLMIGHKGNWKDYRADVRRVACAVRATIGDDHK